MSAPAEHHLRVEVTLLDPKLQRDKAEWPSSPRSRLLFCTPFQDAVSPPFPAEGKQGVSVWVGPLTAFRDPKTRLLWELEKRRQRPTVVVLTSQKGRSFLRAFRELGTLLSDTSLAPISFLRRRGQEWDSLDFLSPGDSTFMAGANPRLKRLKQAGWEYVVDSACMFDAAVKEDYFRTLEMDRTRLLDTAKLAFSKLRLSPLVGIAGECLNREFLFTLLEEPLLASILARVDGQAPPASGHWLLLAKREAGRELLLYGHGVAPLEVGQIVQGAPSGGRSEFAVAEVLQDLKPSGSDGVERFQRVIVDWRYPPEREIPTLWKQKSVPLAGSRPPGG